MSFSVYQKVTDAIIQKLEAGTIPWQKGFTNQAGELPTNFVTKKEYNGINAMLLACSGFESKYWLTFNQAKKLNGKVIAGMKASFVVFYTLLEPEEINDCETETDNDRKFVLRYYNVFNVEQIKFPDSVVIEKPKPVVRKHNDVVAAENIIAGYINRPEIQHFKALPNASYVPVLDLIKMPEKDCFHDINSYYATLFHEAIHSTGHNKRLNRFNFDNLNYGSKTYSKEELTAEIGSAFLCEISGIDNQIDNAAAYIKSWLRVLRENKSYIVSAARAANKATDFILGKQF